MSGGNPRNSDASELSTSAEYFLYPQLKRHLSIAPLNPLEAADNPSKYPAYDEHYGWNQQACAKIQRSLLAHILAGSFRDRLPETPLIFLR